VIEVRSQTDRWRALPEKMREWIEIDPESRTVEIYLPNGRVEILSNPESLKGEALLQGFALDLLPVWDPLNH
jgi:Uma2 family endonuclease